MVRQEIAMLRQPFIQQTHLDAAGFADSACRHVHPAEISVTQCVTWFEMAACTCRTRAVVQRQSRPL
jgi:hypothetical protein